jgi:dTDP-glucose 4,6-dehydratase
MPQLNTLLVTGGAGFIGANFIHYWQKKWPEALIINLDALTYAGSLAHLSDLPHPDQHIFVEGSITDRALLEQLFTTHPIDTIVHFAAESHVDNSIKNPAIFVETNVLGTQILLDAARRHSCHFHHISTDEVYGSLSPTAPAFTEHTPYAPNSPYSASKAGSDHLVRAYHHTFGLAVTTSNCSNNFGPRQHAEKFIPTVIRACLTARDIPVYGNGSNVRDWLYVEDHCAAIDLILRKGKVGETYNVGGRNEWSNLAVVKAICTLFDELRPRGTSHHDLIRFVNDRPGHDWRYAIDPSKIIAELGWSPTEHFENHLKTMIIKALASS